LLQYIVVGRFFNTRIMEEKAKKILWEYLPVLKGWENEESVLPKECAIIAVKNEYKSNRELLFNLKSCGVIESEKVYLSRLQGLIDEEALLIEEIEKL
jgi:hypothetical protein